jgi:hypothetical protein
MDPRNRREKLRRYATLLGEQTDQPGIGLVRRKCSDLCSSNSALSFYCGDGPLHARDGRSRQRLPIKLHRQAAISRIPHTNSV